MAIAATDEVPVAELRHLLAEVPGLEFAVLIGSRARGDGTPASDWDLAVQWARGPDWLERLGRTAPRGSGLGSLQTVAPERSSRARHAPCESWTGPGAALTPAGA